jgi:hypothetical protein
MKCLMMVSLGVYVLGAASDAERRQLEAHLRGCQECQEELRRLAPLPGLLAGLPQGSADSPLSPGRRARSPKPSRLATQSRPPGRARAQRGTRLRWAVAAAACLAAAAGGGLWLSAGTAGPQPTVLTRSGADPATHVAATATLTATSWGTSIELQVSGLPENVDCRLVVHSRNGRDEVSGVWDAWAKGPVSIPASASWLPSDIASLQVTTSARSLITITVNNPAAHL